MDKINLQKLEKLNNRYVTEKIEEAIKLCKPAKVNIISDSKEDINYVRKLALDTGEEKKLKMEGHTIHFDGYYDQARDKEHTKYLLSQKVNWGLGINYIEKDKGLKEVHSFLDGSMAGKEMLVRFFSLGPTNSMFSLRALQITDSAYVAHSEDLLYRQGYQEFKKLNGSPNFFFFLHSAGRLENGVSADINKRRIYIDLEENRVFSVNNQYAGNSIGLKKLAFRLAINKAQHESWLAEHMFIMGVHGPKNRVSYFTGAFPSACGKTSTAMIPGQTVVGDDIAYLRKVNGEVRAVNVESGIFGIIRDVNPDDDPLIYQALTTPRELIFSNVLINDDKPYWLGMKKDIPKEGVNYSGEWTKSKKDDKGNEITPSHKNARYTIRLNALKNIDERADDPTGVPIKAV
ncbi:MAG: phosphoenolpyruvate carboxykinase (GTP), partial [Candidatus Atribacteria bacterium]|nr:phosphoenolpyruvate carboxykinase (GTP) [Candidatus Atribacteria bacterium]